MATKRVDPLRRHADARERVEQVERDLARMGAFFAQLGNALEQSPVRVMIADGQFQAPESVVGGMPMSVTPEEWPSWQLFKDTLIAYYTAEAEAARAEDDLSTSDRKTLGLS